MRMNSRIVDSGFFCRLFIVAFLGVAFAASSSAAAWQFDRSQYISDASMQAAVPLNVREAVSSFNANLEISNARVDSKMMLTDKVGDGLFSTLFAFQAAARAVKGEVYTFSATSVPYTKDLMTNLVDKELQGKVTATGAEIVSFVSVASSSTYYTAVAMSFTAVGSDGCSLPVTVVELLAVANSASAAEAQHTEAAQAYSAAVQPQFPPGNPLPSGVPLPAAPPSPYGGCVSKLGPRPGTAGLSDPCDIAIATALQCAWDANCDATRASSTAVRKTVTSGLGVVGTFAVGAALCVPGLNVGVVIGGIVATGIGAWATWDAVQDATTATEDAAAALRRKEACWKRLLADLDAGACG